MLYRDEDEEDFFPDVKEYADTEQFNIIDDEGLEDEVDPLDDVVDPMPKGCLFVPAIISFIVVGATLLYATS